MAELLLLTPAPGGSAPLLPPLAPPSPRVPAPPVAHHAPVAATAARPCPLHPHPLPRAAPCRAGAAANGAWFFVVGVGVGVDRGQTRRRGFATRKAAQAELTSILGSLEQRTYVPPKRQTLAAFLTDVWLPAIEHTIKPGTFESYRQIGRANV